MNQTHLKKFQKYVKKWRDHFGLKQYRLTVNMCELSDDEYAAETSVDKNNSFAIISLSKNIDKLPDKILNEIALHEVLEILLDSLRSMSSRHYNWQLVDREVHRVIRTLENVTLKR